MYYDEKIIDGIMHWRNSPDGKWMPYTVATLTNRYASMLARMHELERVIMQIHETTDIG